MPANILKAIIFLHRIVDHKDFFEKVVCIPPSRADELEKELLKRTAAGEIDTVQVGRIYIEATVRTPHEDEVDRFLAKIDSKRLHSSMDRATPSEGEDDGPIPSEAPKV